MDFSGKIEDPTGLPTNVQEIITRQLISGKSIAHPVWLMGGGQVHKKYFLKTIGDKKYQNAYEWCAGHGEIGFELITAGICKTLVFSDMHPGSTEWCLKNAKDLGLETRISAYTSPAVGAIPQHELWDLVVGNPPNSLGVDPVIIKRAAEENWSDDHLLLFARTTWDIGLNVHKEFFKSIVDQTTPDVDIFITVDNSIIKTIRDMAEEYGLILVSKNDMFPDPYPEYQHEDILITTDPGLKVVHFKKKMLTT